MSTLQESVDARRASKSAEFACVIVGAAQGPTLTVAIWRSRSWVLPWSHLVAASFAEADETETLELSFMAHVVVATGQNLQRVLDEVSGFRVVSLRNLPANHRARLPADAPFIAELDVRSIRDVS